jgi:hypothetical protein
LFYIKSKDAAAGTQLVHLTNFFFPLSSSCRGLAVFDALFLATAILAFGLPKLWLWYDQNLAVYIMVGSFGLLHTFR